jgi:hypothetical protein
VLYVYLHMFRRFLLCNKTAARGFGVLTDKAL